MGAEFSAGDFACSETQVDGAGSRVTVKIYIMYKVKNKKKNGRPRSTCSEASETAVRSARGSGQVRQGPGNNNHRPIC